MLTPGNKYYPYIFLLVIFGAIYFMYGDAFSPQQIDLSEYQQLCLKYKSAAKGIYSTDEVQMLINEVNYLIPKEINELTEPAKRGLKACAGELIIRLKQNK